MTQTATRTMGSPAAEAITLLAYAAAPVFGLMAGLSALDASGMSICSGAAMPSAATQTFPKPKENDDAPHGCFTR